MHLAETERLLVLPIPLTDIGAAKRRAQGQRHQTWEPDMGSHRGACQKKIGYSFGSHQIGALCLWGGQRLWALGGPGHSAELPSCLLLHLRSRVLGERVQLISWGMHSHTSGSCIPWSYITTQGSLGSCGCRVSQSLSGPLWAISATLWSIINS